MPDFDALGRDVAAAADSLFDNSAATAVKQLWVWAGFDQGDNPNHLWTVSASCDPGGFSVTAVVKDTNVYVPTPYPSAPSTPEELAAVAPAVEDAPAPTEPAPAEDAADTPTDPPAEETPAPEVAAPADPPVAASSDESSTPSDSATDAAAS